MLTNRRFVYHPLVIFLSWNLLTYLVFLFGPFDWRIDNVLLVSFFVFSCLLSIALGFLVGTKTAYSIRFNIQKHRNLSNLILYLGGVIFLLSIYFYTGKIPWDLPSYIFNDSSINYNDFQSYIASSGRDSRVLFVIFKIFLQPFIIVKIFETLFSWKIVNLLQKLSLISLISGWLLFSISRGTDKEIGDIFLLFFVFLASRYAISPQKSLNQQPLAIPLLKIIFTIILSISLLLTLVQIFSQRKFDRLQNTTVCLFEANTCSELHFGDDDFSKSIEFSVSIISSYISQGYYGLSLALKEEFESTFGTSHSLFLLDLTKGVLGSDFIERSYLVKNGRYGWSYLTNWSTAYVAIASDISFIAVPFVFLFAGFLFACVWINYLATKNIYTLSLFYYFVVFFVYLPANMQVTNTPESYFAVLTLLFIWFKNSGVLKSAKNLKLGVA
jgi:hypothetical protein